VSAQYEPSPFPPYDPDARDTRLAAPSDTPPGAEARLEGYSNDLDVAEQQLTAARKTELDAQEERDAAERRVRLSEGCPKIGVFGGIRTTTAYVNAWVEEQIAAEEHEYKLAKAAQQAAKLHFDKLSRQGGWQQSKVASVRETYRGTNGRRWS
jgi:hypothetical protein